VLADYYWDWEGAERAFRRAIELDPDYVAARYWYSELLANLGRTAEALEMTRRAREVDPLSQLARADEGRAYYLARRYDEAIDSFRETLELGPQFVAQLYLGLAHSQAGRHAEAIAAMQSFQAAYPRSPEVGLLGYVYARAGRHAEARRVLEERTDAHEPGDSSPMVIAGIHSGLGDLDAAFEWLQVAYEGRAWQMVFLRQEPVFDPLRGDPRYADLLDRLGLGE
ncbi:MAG: tetratricopeptide repeat protein, partial [Gemmatimonadota bacterium]